MSEKLVKERLINCREKLCVTKQEAARRMNMSQPAYLRYESGERAPSIHVIRTMADILQTSVEYLTGQTNDPSPTSYTIRSNTEPELFDLIIEYRNASDEAQRRLLVYARQINRETGSSSFS